MRPPVDTIAAPPFPVKLPWANVASLRMDQQRDRPVLVEFWDFCRVSSLRTLPYLRAWHERYAEDGLRVVSVHSPGFAASQDDDAVRAAVARLGIEHPVLIDRQLRLWTAYDNEGWPARYLWAPAERGHVLREFHYGEGGYAETELAIQELLGVEREPVGPLRPEDDPQARVVVPTRDRAGAWSGPYEAGGVWAVLSGAGEVRANGRTIRVEHPGAYPLVEHDRHTTGVLDLEVGDGVVCEAVCFTPGVAP
ncbi:MAG TPA: DipZ protein [Solirubrobacteraceae bacterium]|nr:DipZ protein [Solirubrobacteraceae bacterium]